MISGFHLNGNELRLKIYNVSGFILKELQYYQPNFTNNVCIYMHK